MNVRILFLLLVCKATKCDKIAESRTLVALTIDDKCKNVKCSAQEDPTCVKIKNLKDIEKVFHVIALNKCELQFMKCHKDYEASIVAMKLCENDNIMKRKKTQNSTVTHRGRVKRSIFGRSTTARGHSVFDSASSEEYSGHKIHKDDIYDDKETLSLSISAKQVDKKKATDEKKANNIKVLSQRPHIDGEKTMKKEGFYLRPPSDAEKGYGKQGLYLIPPRDVGKGYGKKGLYLIPPGDAEKGRGKKGHFTITLNDALNGNWKKGLYLIPPGDAEKGRGKKGLKLHLHQSEEKESELIKLAGSIEGSKEGSGELLIEEIAPDVFKLFSEETIAERINNADDSVPENNDKCPDSCPAQSDMICVKCPHGVYKTFLSTCHFRQYCCRNGGESRRNYRRTDLNEKEKNKRINMSASRASANPPQKDLCKDMELVSRQSCILSAPFIDHAGVTSHGRVYNENDKAGMLSYFKCKSLGVLGKSDPRCPF